VPKRFLSALCLLLILGVSVACLYPFNFKPDNRVHFLGDGEGLQFLAPVYHSKRDSGGIAFNSGIMCSGAGACLPGEISISARLTPAAEAVDCLKRVIDFRGPSGREFFFVGQWKSNLILRSFISVPIGKAYREIGLRDALITGKTVSIAITSGVGGTTLFIEGLHAKTYPDFRLLDGSASLAGVGVFIGNSPDLNCPWSGVVSGLSLIGKELSLEEVQVNSSPGIESPCRGQTVACYDFGSSADGSTCLVADRSGNGNNLIVDKYLVFNKPLLQMPKLEKKLFVDIVANVIGFIPIGMVFSLWFMKVGELSKARAACFAVLSGSVLSLILEAAQAWLPGRDSSMLDLIINTLGAEIGALVLLALAGGRFWRQGGSAYKA
jgi:VanZ family protein